MNSDTANIIYLLECTKCAEMHIGESKRPLKEPLSEHAKYAISVIPSKATGEHFNRPGHSLSNMKFIIKNQTNQRTYIEKKGKRFS